MSSGDSEWNFHGVLSLAIFALSQVWGQVGALPVSSETNRSLDLSPQASLEATGTLLPFVDAGSSTLHQLPYAKQRLPYGTKNRHRVAGMADKEWRDCVSRLNEQDSTWINELLACIEAREHAEASSSHFVRRDMRLSTLLKAEMAKGVVKVPAGTQLQKLSFADVEKMMKHLTFSDPRCEV